MRPGLFLAALLVASLLPAASALATAQKAAPTAKAPAAKTAAQDKDMPKPLTSEKPELEFYAELPFAPGNIAITGQNLMVVSLHQFYGPTIKVATLGAEGAPVPFPNEKMQAEFGAVLGIRATIGGIVWMLDNGGGVRPPKLVGWNTTTSKLFKSIPLAELVYKDSFLNDLAVDPARPFIYIADSAGPAHAGLIVVNTETGKAWRALDGHASMKPEDVDIKIDNVTVLRNGKPARIGLNPITIDPSGMYLYYGAMNGTTLYRVPTTELVNLYLKAEELATRVEAYAKKPVSDGITIDSGGNIYVTDLNSKGIGVITPDKEYRLLFHNPNLNWPDGMATGPDGYIYVTVDQLQRSAPLSASGANESAPPYRIIRFAPLAPGAVGR